MEPLPFYINALFAFTTLLTIFLFYKAAGYAQVVLIVLLSWMALQSVIGLSGFYTVTSQIPPRFVLLILPPLFFILLLFITTKGKQFIDQLDEKTLTLLHSVRVLVEIVLYGLFLHKGVPQVMTFEGSNFDVLSGLTAPLIFYFGYIKQQIDRRIILIWNFICLGFLINIVTYALLSAPFPFQQLAFDQPNRALMYFPFIWLPCCIVPLVLFSQLATIRRLLKPRHILTQAIEA